MTHKDIYTKFMIEYDKANVTSSYPSLTEYEVATVLDKAYNALIAQKVTGNNVRRSAFETDVKAIADIQPLIKSANVTFDITNGDIVPNRMHTNLEEDCLYFLEAYLKYQTGVERIKKTVVNCDFNPNVQSIPNKVFKLPLLKEDIAFDNFVLEYSGEDTTFRCCYLKGSDQSVSAAFDFTISTIKTKLSRKDTSAWDYILAWVDRKDTSNETFTFYYENTAVRPYDNRNGRMVPTQIVNHNTATKFFSSAYNMPWIKIPVSYIEDDILYVVYDLLNAPTKEGQIVYIKKPNLFAKDLSKPESGWVSYFDWGETENVPDEYQFECNDTVAEELISLAIAFALENVESPRLNTKLNMRGLEA